MNNAVARAVCTVIRALLDPISGEPANESRCSDELPDALAVLADAASRQLAAGPRGAEIRTAWDAARPIVLTARQQAAALALVEQWRDEAAHLETGDSAQVPDGEAPHEGRDTHDVEADTARARVLRDLADALHHIAGGLPGMVLGLDLEAASAMKDLDRSLRHDPEQIGQIGALSGCRMAVAALLPSAEPYVYGPAAAEPSADPLDDAPF